jgi:acyl carrier protein
MTQLIPELPESLDKERLVSHIRTLISQRSGIAVEHVTLDSNFFDDLGLDWLDVVELIVLVEQQFPDIAVADDGHLACLDDLIRNIQVGDNAANKDAAGYTEQQRQLRLVT